MLYILSSSEALSQLVSERTERSEEYELVTTKPSDELNTQATRISLLAPRSLTYDHAPINCPQQHTLHQALRPLFPHDTLEAFYYIAIVRFFYNQFRPCDVQRSRQEGADGGAQNQ